MEDYIVSARKYRPDSFSAVVGQQSIVTTLKNAIRKEKLGHAYLFFGPRGVGKTTCARIFARTINCMNITSETEACGTCESCTSFRETRSYNIHELDAASNNSVDDIRNLTDQVRIPPQVGRYNIYIIDEVHMLSAQAFNAFLKTLEEPPAHAVFILATTEKHKIIPTVLSRCQVYDFNRIKVSDIVNYLRQIADKEKIEYEEDALNMIAQKADGAMRDALSIFDQMVSFSSGKVKYIDVINNLNILDYDYYFSLTQAMLAGDVSKLLLIFDEILIKGFDPHNFLTGLSSHLRDLLVCKDPVTIQLLETGEGIRERYGQQSSQCSPDFLLESLELANRADMAFRTSRNQRLLIELLLIRLARIGGGKKKQQLKDEAVAEEQEPSDDSRPSSESGSGSDNKSETASESDKAAASDSDSASLGEKRPDAGSGNKPGKPDDSDGGEQPTTGPAVERKRSATTPSIKDALNGNRNAPGKGATEDRSVDAATSRKETEFSKELLHEKWSLFTERIRDKKRMYSFLKNHLPVLEPDFRIVVNFSNADQLEMFNTDIRAELKAFLAEQLNNNVFEIVPDLPEVEGNSELLYTQEDKFEHLQKKNPALGKLKKDFNLDFE